MVEPSFTSDPRLDDLVQPFQIENLGVNGRMVRLGLSLDAVVGPHAYPAAVRDLMCQMVVMTATLASVLKYDGVFTLQTQGDGPISLMMADVTSSGGLRAYARFDADRLADLPPSSAPVPSLMGSGHLAFTVDQGPDTERYQGITELTGATLADCAHTYFRQSEQLETAVFIAAGDEPMAAGAMMLQRLPLAPGISSDEADEDWRRAVILMSSLTPKEILDPMIMTDDLLFRLYHEDGVRVTESRQLVASCRCSREKVASTLASFPKTEIVDLTENGLVNVTCEFCRTEYDFDSGQIDALFAT